MKNVFDITDFGAIADNKTDSTQAIQRAIDEAEKVQGKVFVPAGKYLCGQLTMKPFVTIEGVDYQIVDIGLRMLEPRELYGCQGFPEDYIIDRDIDGKPYSRTEQVKRCGNAVCPPIPAALVKANLPELCVATRMPNMSIKEEQTGQLRLA